MRIRLAIAISSCLLFAVAGCALDPNTNSAAPKFAIDDFPRLDGSTATIPLASKLLQHLTGISADEADVLCEFSTTSQAYRALATSDGPSLILAYELDQDTREELESSGAKFEYHPIGRDALVFLTNQNNPITGLTTEQIRAIYTGQTTNWSAVGGTDQPIIAFQRPEESGSQALLRKLVMGDTELAEAPMDRITFSMGGLIDSVANYSNTGNALGYSVFYYVNNMLAMPEIKLLAVNGVQPSPETIADGSYPFSNDFYAVVQATEPEGSPARQVIEWLESPAGAQLITDAGYVSLK
jgi:phosphate transport system substrate-binding protein